MLILQEEQVQTCQVKLNKEHRAIPGFIYVNRLFIPIESQEFYDWETVIPEYKRWLLEENVFCVILQQSECYSIWCFAPRTAKINNR
jgi:hypothetical protein